MGYTIPKPQIIEKNGSENIFIGSQSGFNNNGSYNVYIGNSGNVGNSGYPGLSYVNFVSNNIDKAISYTEHIAEKMDENVEYLTEKIGGIQIKNPIRTVHLIPNIDLVPELDFISQTISKDEEKLNWWCEKNKTSGDFWKYKL